MAAKAKTAPTRKRGRPPLPEGEGKRYPLSMRTTKALRSRLEAARIDSGRSLAQEVEHRLDDSFRAEKYLAIICGGGETAKLFKQIINVRELIEYRCGKLEWNVLEIHEAYLTAVSALVAYKRPAAKGEGLALGDDQDLRPEPLDEHRASEAREVGLAAAWTIFKRGIDTLVADMEARIAAEKQSQAKGKSP